jgi:hypothetical protein
MAAMSGTRTTIVWNKLRRLGLAAQLAAVSATIAGAWSLTAPVAYAVSGIDGLLAAAAAAGVCWLGAALALAAGRLFHGPSAALYAMTIGMLARTFLPLALGVVLQLNVPRLAENGMIFYLLIFYAVAMAVETTLTLSQIAPTRAT